MGTSTLLCTQISLFFISSLALTSAVSNTGGSRTRATGTPQGKPFKKIYAFGDSFTDTGNTESVTGPKAFVHVSNFPYGMTFFHHPTNRYSDGRLVIDFVAESLSLPHVPPYRHIGGRNASLLSTSGVNFAVAGSTAINHAFFVKNNITMNLTPQSIATQLLWFNKYLEDNGCKGPFATGENGCKENLDDALFWIGEIGVNDYAYSIGSTVSGDTIRELGVQTVYMFLQALLRRGAKYMVVQGLPSSGCLPLAMSLAPETDRDEIGCVGTANNQTYTHNIALQAKLQELRRQFPGAVIVYADYWNAYHTVMKNPKAYGFKEAFKACCGTGEPYNFDVFATCGSPSVTACSSPHEYINWDGVHLTEAMYKVMANMFLSGSFSQPPFSHLLSMKMRVG